MIKLIIKAAREFFIPKTPQEIIRDVVVRKARRDFAELQKCTDLTTADGREKLGTAIQSIWLANGLEGAGISNDAWIAATGLQFPPDEDIKFGAGMTWGIRLRQAERRPGM